MGTLFEQRPRSETLRTVTEAGLKQMLEIMGVDGKPTLEEWVCAARMLEAGLKLQSVDVLDEQLSGFGEMLRSLLVEIESYMLR